MADQSMQRQGRRPRSEGARALVLSIAFILLSVLAAVIGYLVIFVLHISDETMLGGIIVEGFEAAAVVLGVLLLGGKSWARPSRQDFAWSLHLGGWILLVSLGLMAYDLIVMQLEGNVVVQEGCLSRLVELLAFCLVIGVYEEFLFRGLMLNGLLAVMGRTHAGVVMALAVTSLLFGLAHVGLTSSLGDPLLLAQALLKIVETGMFSLVMCVVVLRTRCLVGVTLLHGLSDYFLFLPSVVLGDESLDVEYVVEGEEGYYVLAIYAILILLYLPSLVRALRELQRGQDVYLGGFVSQAPLAVTAPPTQDSTACALPSAGPEVPGTLAPVSEWRNGAPLPPGTSSLSSGAGPVPPSVRVPGERDPS